jgi:hypothetical protein
MENNNKVSTLEYINKHKELLQLFINQLQSYGFNVNTTDNCLVISKYQVLLDDDGIAQTMNIRYKENYDICDYINAYDYLKMKGY